VSAARDDTNRLLELERILTETKTVTSADAGLDPVDVHLGAVPAERIRELTSMLDDAHDGGHDSIDGLTMRLLLNDFTTAVGHLRAVAQVAAARIDEAAGPVRDSQSFLKREARREEEMELTKAARPA